MAAVTTMHKNDGAAKSPAEQHSHDNETTSRQQDFGIVKVADFDGHFRCVADNDAGDVQSDESEKQPDAGAKAVLHGRATRPAPASRGCPGA